MGTLYNLVFRAENKEILKKYPGLVEKLKDLAQSPEFEVSKGSKGILYLLNELSLEQAPDLDGKGAKFDVMISYNWVPDFSRSLCFPISQNSKSLP